MSFHSNRSTNPSATSKTALSTPALIQYFLYLLGQHKKRFLLLLFGIFLTNVHALIPPLILGAIVNTFVYTPPQDRLARIVCLSALFGAVFVIVALIRLTLKNAFANVKIAVGCELRVRGFESLLQRSLTGETKLSGRDTQKVITGVTDFYELTRMLSGDLSRFCAGFVGSVVVFLFIRAELILVFVGYFLTFTLLLRYFSRKLLRLQLEAAKATEHTTGTIVDSLSNAQSVVGHGASEQFTNHVAAGAGELQALEKKIVTTSTNQWKSFQALTGLSLALVLVYLGLSADLGKITPGLVITFFGYFHSLVQNCSDLLDIWEGLQKRQAGLSRLSQVIRPADPETALEQEALQNWKEIELRNIRFRYPTVPHDALQDVSLQFKRGERVAVAGLSGSGKSTLARILCGLLQPTKGELLIDELSVSGLSMQSHWSFAFQECELFALSLRDNITLMRDIDDGIFEQCLEICGIPDIAAKLPLGLDTIVGEKGYTLSGGERQRISLARALCRRPSVLVFDEATSMLDDQAESGILEKILTFLPDSLIIIISHHQRSLRFAERTVNLTNGQITAS